MNAVVQFFDLTQLAAQICQVGLADLPSVQLVGAQGVQGINSTFQTSNSPHVQAPLNNVTPGGANLPATPTVPPFGFDNDPTILNPFYQNFLTLIKNEQNRVT